MARWYNENPEYTQISKEDKDKCDRIVAVLEQYKREMEHYSYYGSNPGIPEDDFEDVADDIMKEFGL